MPVGARFYCRRLVLFVWNFNLVTHYALQRGFILRVITWLCLNSANGLNNQTIH